MSKTIIYTILILSFVAVWVWAAIDPLYYDDWILENILVFIAVPILLWTRKRFEFSLLSYSLITIFFIVHLIGAHYTYAEVPWGVTLGQWLGTERNMYDRLIHLLFGVLWTYPIYELSVRSGKMQGFWRYFVPFMTVSAFAGFYEVAEWAAAVVVAPEAGTAFLGSQGDVWDAQKDMMLAMAGSLGVLLFLGIVKKIKMH
jgi:putative membrane protein